MTCSLFGLFAGRSYVRPAEKPYVERSPSAPQQRFRPDPESPPQHRPGAAHSPEAPPPRPARDTAPGQSSPPRPAGRPSQEPPPPPPPAAQPSPQTPRAADTPASPETSPESLSPSPGSAGPPRDAYGSSGPLGSPPAGLVSETRRRLELGLQVEQIPTPQLFPPAPARPPKPDSLRAPPAEASPPPPESSSASEESLDQVPSRDVASAALLQLDRLVSGPEKEASPPPPPPPPPLGQDGHDGVWGAPPRETGREVNGEGPASVDAEQLQVRCD